MFIFISVPEIQPKELFEYPKPIESHIQKIAVDKMEHPKILQTRDLSNDIIQKSLCSKDPETRQTDKESTTDKENIPKDCVLEGSPSCSSDGHNIVTQIETNDVTSQIEDAVVIENKDGDLAVIPLDINDKDLEDVADDIATKMIDSGLVLPPESPGDAGNSSECRGKQPESCLNNSVVPYEYISETGEQQQKLLVSYPVSNDPNIPRPHLQKMKHETKNMCNCMAEKGYCNCVQCNRRPEIPFGKRFPADVDVLQQITNPVRHPQYSSNSGHSSYSDSQYSSGYEQLGNQRANEYFAGYNMVSGSGYYRDPSREILYREPTVVDVVKTPNYSIQTKPIESHFYKVVPKYDIVLKQIPSLDVPDLIPTNRHVCRCPMMLQDSLKSSARSHFYCPVHGNVPYSSNRPNDERVVIGVPDGRSPINTGYFLNHVLDLKDIR